MVSMRDAQAAVRELGEQQDALRKSVLEALNQVCARECTTSAREGVPRPQAYKRLDTTWGRPLHLRLCHVFVHAWPSIYTLDPVLVTLSTGTCS